MAARSLLDVYEIGSPLGAVSSSQPAALTSIARLGLGDASMGCGSYIGSVVCPDPRSAGTCASLDVDFRMRLISCRAPRCIARHTIKTILLSCQPIEVCRRHSYFYFCKSVAPLSIYGRLSRRAPQLLRYTAASAAFTIRDGYSSQNKLGARGH